MCLQLIAVEKHIHKMDTAQWQFETLGQRWQIPHMVNLAAILQFASLDTMFHSVLTFRPSAVTLFAHHIYPVISH